MSNLLSNSHYLGSEEYPAIITSELFKTVQHISGFGLCWPGWLNREWHPHRKNPKS